MSIGEFDLIQEYFQRQAGGLGVTLGIGDDCALLQPPSQGPLAVSMDTLVAGVHFPRQADSELIAERALRVNLSDLAAMGADPLWFTLGLTLPSADPQWLDGFSRGLFAVAHEYNCVLVGGDTTKGPLAMSIQVHGSVPNGQALRRSGASIGDYICVSGPLGDGAAALAVLKGELETGTKAATYLLDRYFKPEPQLALGVALRGLASAAIDVSDGLLADLGHICDASLVAASVDVEDVPVSPAVSQVTSPDVYRPWALAGGDDYQLCFTVAPERLTALQALKNRYPISIIGRIVKGEGVHCTLQGDAYELEQPGYRHFQASGATEGDPSGTEIKEDNPE